MVTGMTAIVNDFLDWLRRRDREAVDFNPGAVAELAAFAVLFLVIEWLLPGQSNLSRISPHPLWIMVVVMSCRHGTSMAIASAVTATLVSLLVGEWVHGDDLGYFNEQIRQLRDPALWLLAALCLGEWRNHLLHIEQGLQKDLSRANEHRAQLGQYCHDLQTHVVALERDRATDADVEPSQATEYAQPPETSPADGGIARLLASRLLAVSRANGDELPDALAEAVRVLFGRNAHYVVYLHSDRTVALYEPLSRLGSADAAAAPEAVLGQVGGPAVQKAGAAPADDAGWVTAPLAVPDEGGTAGVFALRRTGQGQTVETDEIIVRALAIELARAIRQLRPDVEAGGRSVGQRSAA